MELFGKASANINYATKEAIRSSIMEKVNAVGVTRRSQSGDEKLTGEAQVAARTLDPTAMVDYLMLKAAILNHMGATLEGYRRKFWEEVFAHRLKDYAMGWLNPDATTKARLMW
ncbi:UNVERIFIED_CONTAM: hypothetical protein FKN15_049456 [Acipenser sinensis]